MGLLFALAAGLTACWLMFVFVAPVVCGIYTLIAAGVVFFQYATASASVFRGAVEPIGHLGIEPRLATGAEKRPPEPAYRSYFFGPVFRDYSYMVRTASQLSWERSFGQRNAVNAVGLPASSSLSLRFYDGWSRLTENIPLSPGAAKAVAVGPLIGGMVGLGVGTGLAAIVIAVISIVFGVMIAITVVLAVIIAGLLKLIEILVLRIRGITVECAVCHRRATSPTYLCPHCAPGSGTAHGGPALHRRLVPGSHGVFSRTCQCGNSLPTLLIRGKWRLDAYCQYDGCREQLPLKGLTAPTFHIPIAAGRQAGKTVYMTAAVAGLEQQLRDQTGAGGFEFAHREALPEYVRSREALQRSALEAIGATLPVVSIRAFNIYLGEGRRRRLMYLYDPAGERLEGQGGMDTLTFLGHTDGAIVVVDPFSFRPVRNTQTATALAQVRGSMADADDVVLRFIEGLRRSVNAKAGEKLKFNVAVVLTKCDALLDAANVAHPYDQLGASGSDPIQRFDRSAAIREWLAGVAGEQSLLNTLDNSFQKSQFFAVSARDALVVSTRSSVRTQLPVRNDDPAAPLQWLLTGKDK